METLIIQVKNKKEARKLMQISADNGWGVRSRDQILQWFVDTAPKDVPLTDEDIMEEIRAVRTNQ
jgi:hypothetical protein